MNWLQVLNVAAAGDETRKATLRIDGIVGYRDWYDETNNTASHFIRTVDALGDLDEINLEINSPGGVVSDGVAITNYLINHEATVNVTVIGQAASIASVIAMAADPGQLHMGIGTTMFVHDPLTIAIGDADDMRETADHLDKIRDSIVSIYQLRTDLSVDEIKDLMSGDTTMTAEEAVEWGFADTMEAELKAVACADLNEYLT
ncbi:MAG: Clp protease ClpP, partial [Candidatus Sedimenticola sp. (ex Thyasira tokunagai)]